MESPPVESVFCNVFVSSFPLSESFVMAFQSYVGNGCVSACWGPLGKQGLLSASALLLLGIQLLVSAHLQYGASIFQILDGTAHLYCWFSI